MEIQFKPITTKRANLTQDQLDTCEYCEVCGEEVGFINLHNARVASEDNYRACEECVPDSLVTMERIRVENEWTKYTEWLKEKWEEQSPISLKEFHKAYVDGTETTLEVLERILFKTTG